MTHHRLRRLAALSLVAAACVPSAAVAATPDLPAGTTPPVQLEDELVRTLNFPDDAKYYSDLSRLFRIRPFLGPDGSPSWFFSRQFAVDDPRAIGLAVARPFTSPDVTTTTIPGTVQLRGDGYAEWGYWPSTGGVSRTSAMAVDGRNWLLDRVLTPRPAHTELRGVVDGAARPKSIRFDAALTPYDAILTDRGLRVIGRRARKSGRRSTGTFVTRPGSTKPIAVPKLDRGVIGAVARPNGGLFVVGRGSGAVPDSVVLVAADGRVRGLADRRKPAAASTTGRAGVVRTSAGVVLDEGSLPSVDTPGIDKTAVVLRDATTGKVRIRRALRDLEFEKVERCRDSAAIYRALALTPSPDGGAALTLSCGTRRAPSIDPSSSQRYTYEDQAVMIGLDAKLRVRWQRWATEYIWMYPNQLGYADYCANSMTDAQGRLLIINCRGEVRAVTIPGTEPRRGKLVRTKRIGPQSVLARVGCRGAEGTVCSGRLLLTANGQPLGSADYALPARPGGAAAELDRQITTTAPLPKRYSVALQPRS